MFTTDWALLLGQHPPAPDKNRLDFIQNTSHAYQQLCSSHRADGVFFLSYFSCIAQDVPFVLFIFRLITTTLLLWFGQHTTAVCPRFGPTSGNLLIIWHCFRLFSILLCSNSGKISRAAWACSTETIETTRDHRHSRTSILATM